MDMLNILKSFDQVENNEKSEVTSTETNSMKTILESFDTLEGCGDMPTPAAMSQPEKVRMNVNLSAEGTDAIEDLISLMGQAKEMQPSMPMNRHDDMKKMIALSSDTDMDMDEEDEWDNSPEEEYSDHEKMTKDLSGGINRQKKQFKAAQPGDNAMAMETEELETSIKEQLLQALSEKKKGGKDGKACWDGYYLAGTKMKGGKEVDDCRPRKKPKKK